MTTNEWIWTYAGWDPDQEGLRESICALGNGAWATRGALPESRADGVHYPGTYLASVYNRLSSEVAGREVENESLVNVPNWLTLTFTRPDGTVFDLESCTPLDHDLELDIRRSLLTRRSRLEAPDGAILSITQRRFVSLRDRHLAGLQTTLVAENWSGPLTVHSALDGTVTNAGVTRYAELPSDHLTGLRTCATGGEAVCLEVETTHSHIRIAQTARTRVFRDGRREAVPRRLVERDRYVAHDLTVDLAEGEPLVIEKVLAMFTSRDEGIYEPHQESELWGTEIAGEFEELLERHVISWRHAWARSQITLTGADPRTSAVLNLHQLHLLQTVSKNTAELDAGVPARGLHGEAYRGHVFWDELFIFPFLNWRVPELTRALLRYRSRRLDIARHLAQLAGYAGAMYPWQSGSNGREETQTMHLNPKSGHWLPDASHLQRHVNVAVAYNVWAYWQVTRDLEFLRFWGAEMLLEIARFWCSASSYDHVLDRYEIRGVMGPDEYHDGYPDRDAPGLDNNAYTNLMAVWCIEHAFAALDLLPPTRAGELREKLGLGATELDRWGDVSRKMRLCFHDGVLSQFQGYDELLELDWTDYVARYGDISRLDRILEAEGDTPNRYRVSKQPDVLMLYYLLPPEEVHALIAGLGYEVPEDFFRRNVEYYDRRTSHGSTLSQMIHAWVYARLDQDRSWELLRQALVADVEDTQGGTTAEGIHLGAMAGTVDLVQRCYTGMQTRADRLIVDPMLPSRLTSVAFSVRYRGHTVDLAFSHEQTDVSVREYGPEGTIQVEVSGTLHELAPGRAVVVPRAAGTP